MKCENCGTILEGGICSNCQEELFIVTYQSEFIDKPLSKEFLDKVEEQEDELKGYNRGDAE
jgi:hypothetical protein